MKPISEKDWQTFKRLRSVALERFSQRVLDECQAVCGDSSLRPHERYRRVYSLMQERDKEIARAFDDLRRSTAILSLIQMRSQALLTTDELAELSEEIREASRIG